MQNKDTKQMKIQKHVDKLVECLKEKLRSKALVSEAMQGLVATRSNKEQIKLFLKDMTRLSPDGHVWTPEDVADFCRFGVMHKANPEQIENAFAYLVIKALCKNRKKGFANPVQTVEAAFWEFVAALREQKAVG